MPVFHCKHCHHEWEGGKNSTTCDWCKSDGAKVLEEMSAFERMARYMFRKKGELDKIVFEQAAEEVWKDVIGFTAHPSLLTLKEKFVNRATEALAKASAELGARFQCKYKDICTARDKALEAAIALQIEQAEEIARLRGFKK